MRSWSCVVVLGAALVLPATSHAQRRLPGEPPPPLENVPTGQRRLPGEPPPPPDQPVQIPPRELLDGELATNAGESVGEEPIKRANSRIFSLTLSPLPLFAQVLKLAIETDVATRWSASFALSAGRPSVIDPLSPPGSARQKRIGYFEIDAQARYFPVGSFVSGLITGIDASYIFADTDQLVPLAISNAAAGFGAGPVLGFKLVTRHRLTLEITFGLRVLLYKPTPSQPTSNAVLEAQDEVNKPRSVVLPMDGRIGWTFLRVTGHYAV